MNKKRLIVFLIFFCLSLSACGGKQRLLIPHPTDPVVLDCDANLMWLADARTPGSTELTYAEALIYVDLVNNNNVDNIPYSNWRLPAGIPPDDETCRHGCDNCFYQTCKKTEFGDLFFNVLGGCDARGLETKCLLGQYVGYGTATNDNVNLALFDNLPTITNLGPITTHDFSYWSGMQEDSDHVWIFGFRGGFFRNAELSEGIKAQAWLVRDITEGCDQ